MIATRIVLSLTILFVLAAGIAFAGCASQAYNSACTSCSFDKDGKIDQSCSNANQASGTTCVSTSFPIMAEQYAQGKCPAVDTCASQLSACNAKYGTGNDKADCADGSKSVCYSMADSCIAKAAVQCGEQVSLCPIAPAGFILLFTGFCFVNLKCKN
jgi:hypothetical protein